MPGDLRDLLHAFRLAALLAKSNNLSFGECLLVLRLVQHTLDGLTVGVNGRWLAFMAGFAVDGFGLRESLLQNGHIGWASEGGHTDGENGERGRGCESRSDDAVSVHVNLLVWLQIHAR